MRIYLIYARLCLYISVFLLVVISVSGCTHLNKNAANYFQSNENRFSQDWSEKVDQPWVGSEFWANRLQDWKIKDGRLYAIEDQLPMRTVHLLTRSLADRGGTFSMSVSLGRISAEVDTSGDWGGFLIGAGGGKLHYKAASLIHHGAGDNAGIIAALSGDGHLVFRDMNQVGYPILKRSQSSISISGEKQIILKGKALEKNFRLTLEVHTPRNDQPLVVLNYNTDTKDLVGNLALVSHPGKSKARYWFDQLDVKGSKIDRDDSRRFGPVMGTQYTLSNDILKLTAQMPPISLKEGPRVALDIQKPSTSNWQELRVSDIDSVGYLATFRIENWNFKEEVPFRLRFRGIGEKSAGIEYYEGTIQPNNQWRDSVKIAALSCQTLTGNNPRGMLKGMDKTWGGVDRRNVDWSKNYLWFPHLDMINNVRQHEPNLYAFLGDQIYEGGSPTQPDRRGGIKSKLDYLYKWYLWYWAFGDLLRNTPSISIPDDHDVFQGNLWGEAGKKAKSGAKSGGFVMSANFVNMVQYTQTSHLPDPYDSTPVQQDISVYYTNYSLGGVSFAILEDRKFKSSPSTPDSTAQLLGDRQMRFLNDWITNWDDSWMKATLSQTIFGAVHTQGVKKKSRPSSDKDTNGWPAAQRDSVLNVLRKGYAFMIGGDQHLATVVQHGTDKWGDSGYSFAVPAVANFFARSWNPVKKGNNRVPGSPLYTGEYRDGFGNRITVKAVANPEETGHEPSALHDKAPGYGIVTFRKKNRSITMEAWPRYASVDEPQLQYEEWPITISQQDNFGRQVEAYLPKVSVTGIIDPILEVFNTSSGQLLYTIRIEGTSFRPKVFDKQGVYTIKVGDPDTGYKYLEYISPEDKNSVLKVNF